MRWDSFTHYKAPSIGKEGFYGLRGSASRTLYFSIAEILSSRQGASSKRVAPLAPGRSSHTDSGLEQSTLLKGQNYIEPPGWHVPNSPLTTP